MLYCWHSIVNVVGDAAEFLEGFTTGFRVIDKRRIGDIAREMPNERLAVSIGLVGFPLVYGLNLYAVTRLVPERHRPAPLNLALACAGTLFALVGSLLFLATRVLGWGNA